MHKESKMQFELTELKYDMDSMQGIISAETFDYHYNKHHAAYVNKLNALVEGSEYEGMRLEDIIMRASGAIFNNAAQHYNHSFYWNSISPDGGKPPEGQLLDDINESFGSYDNFRQEFSKAALNLFGSGWVWLARNPDGSLEILHLCNAGTPMTLGKKGIITLDVWEHAYYIDHRNDRARYVEMFWDIVSFPE